MHRVASADPRPNRAKGRSRLAEPIVPQRWWPTCRYLVSARDHRARPPAKPTQRPGHGGRSPSQTVSSCCPKGHRCRAESRPRRRAFELTDNLVKRLGRSQPLAQAPLEGAAVYQDHVADSTIAPLGGLLDDLFGCPIEPHLPDQRRRNLRHIRQGGWLVNVVWQQILATREAGTQRVSSTVASENLIRSSQRGGTDEFGVGASSTSSRLRPVITGIQTAGTMDIGSRPASEAAARTTSSRYA